MSASSLEERLLARQAALGMYPDAHDRAAPASKWLDSPPGGDDGKVFVVDETQWDAYWEDFWTRFENVESDAQAVLAKEEHGTDITLTRCVLVHAAVMPNGKLSLLQPQREQPRQEAATGSSTTTVPAATVIVKRDDVECALWHLARRCGPVRHFRRRSGGDGGTDDDDGAAMTRGGDDSSGGTAWRVTFTLPHAATLFKHLIDRHGRVVVSRQKGSGEGGKAATPDDAATVVVELSAVPVPEESTKTTKEEGLQGGAGLSATLRLRPIPRRSSRDINESRKRDREDDKTNDKGMEETEGANRRRAPGFGETSPHSSSAERLKLSVGHVAALFSIFATETDTVAVCEALPAAQSSPSHQPVGSSTDAAERSGGRGGYMIEMPSAGSALLALHVTSQSLAIVFGLELCGC